MQPHNPLAVPSLADQFLIDRVGKVITFFSLGNRLGGLLIAFDHQSIAIRRRDRIQVVMRHSISTFSDFIPDDGGPGPLA